MEAVEINALDGLKGAGEELGFLGLLRLWVPIIHPHCSSGMLVFVEDTAESVSAADVEVSDPSYVCDRCGDGS